MFAILQAIILGIIEGITEFLPISSTGHLIVAGEALNFTDPNEVFTVVIQVGAIAAVIWYYRKDLIAKTIGLFRRDKAALTFWKILAIGTIPAAIIGLAIDSYMSAITIPAVVATTLILGGIVLWAVDRKPVTKQDEPVALERISTKQALLVGLGQSIAIIPGVSRSGATIVSGLAVKLNRSTATAFSFYLSIPVMVAASGLKLVKYGGDLATLPGGAWSLIAGVVAAFITALLAISWLLRYIAHHNFTPFAYYRIIAGIAIFVLIGIGFL